ncbi:MAG: AI-2E family transporter [Bryobacterales bacterium]|nr:AI-2E family transporter [Bryobacterales bacterium]MEB2364295.1 AI-2E family transporter [Bryobacterales bacterium]
MQRGPLIFLTIATLVLLPFVWQIARPFLTPFLLACILAIVMAPVQASLECRLGRPLLATVLTTLTTVLIFGAIVVFTGMALTRELGAAYAELNEQSIEQGGWTPLVTNATDHVLTVLEDWLPLNREQIRAEMIARLKALTGLLLKMIGPVVEGVVSFIVTGFFIALFLYFLLRYGKVWVQEVANLLPLEHATTTSLFQTIEDAIIANMNGVMAVAVAQGILLGAGFWLAGVHSPVLWGVIGGLASVIPMIGSLLVWVPIVIVFLAMGLYWKAILLAAWCALLVGSVDNVVRPLVVGGRIRQHPVLIGLAMIGGTSAFGALGILLGPAIVSLLIALIEEIQSVRSSGNESLTTPATTSSPVEEHPRT